MKTIMMWVIVWTLCVPAVGETIDILTLGAKNDGSEDVSAIVNANTARGTLHFPAGRYKVAQPLCLKNPITGDGYSRGARPDDARTWLVSAIDTTNTATAVVNFGGADRINVERINIRCNSQEAGVRIAGVRGSTGVFISQVGIYNVRGFGLFANGGGSRPVFAQDITIFGAHYPIPGVGIQLDGVVDCRLSNIEIMGTRIGLVVNNGYTYGDNLHIWTGCMAGKDNGSWWKGTRSIVLGPNAGFAGSQIYPDTSFYAIEQRAATASARISNLFYWEDSSTKGAPDHGGAFFHCPPGVRGTLTVCGGLVGVGGRDKSPGWMANVYTPGQAIHDVLVKSDYAITGANLDRLVFSSEKPDYTVDYADAGLCKVADIFTAAPTGACEATLTLDDGAAWRLKFLKTAADEKTSFTAEARNPLCAGRDLSAAETNGVMKVYLRRADATPFSARFTTDFMTERFRPLGHATLRAHNGQPRWREVVAP